MVLSVRAQRSRADDMDHSPAIDQHSYTQPPIPTAPAPRAPASGLPSPFISTHQTNTLDRSPGL